MRRHPKRRTRPVLLSSTLILAVATPGGSLAQSGGSGATSIDPLIVSGTRTKTPVSEIARSVTIVDREQIDEQTKVDQNLGDVLAKLVPGMGPSTEAVTNFGQTLRGRKFLVLVDGIPQSTPLRDASRDLNTIAASSIERIEVVRGGTAMYGFGATGGVVNIITKEASAEPFEAYSRLGTRFSTEHPGSSADVEAEQRISGTDGPWDYMLSGSFIERGGRFDADGNRIPPDPLGTQGGYADTQEYSILGKTGLDFDAGRQRLEFMVNHLKNDQDSDYTFGMELEDGRTPAVPLSEASDDARPVIDPGTENTTGRITYLHRDIADSSMKADVYYGDQRIIFPKFPGFQQGDIVSEKAGARTTIDTPAPILSPGANITWGLDYLTDETEANLFGGDGEPNTPAMDQSALAGFAELELPVGQAGILRGGVRHEAITVDTATVESNVNDNTVLGGELNYAETLFNAGAVFFASDSIDIFTSFSQGFSIADLGRVLRDAGSLDGGETFRAEAFESDAEKVDNYEIGLRYYGDALQGTAAVFYSESDDGATFDDELRIQKFEEEVWGMEGTLDYTLSERIDVGGSLTWADGQRRDADGDQTRLDGTRIAPLKLTAYLAHRTRHWWRNRVQITHVGDRDKFPDAAGPDTFEDFGLGEVERYTLVDLISRLDVGPGRLTVSVRNLLNEDYFPAISQAFNIPTAHSKGRGRTVGLSYGMKW